MAFRTRLLFIYISLFYLSLYSINGLETIQWPGSEISDLDFSWQNCGSASDPIQIKTLDLSPDPIKTPGNVTVSLTVTIASALPTDIHASVTLEKKVGNFYLKVPCMNNVGSCNYGNVCEMWSKFCPKYFEKYGFPCQCPISANTYSVPDAIIDITKKVPSKAIGEFKLTINIGGSSGKLGCFKLQFKLKD